MAGGGRPLHWKSAKEDDHKKEKGLHYTANRLLSAVSESYKTDTIVLFHLGN